ncbi:MAG: hypothetical protein AAB250_00820 [Bdellovibrionota bacterium]
MTKSDIKPLYFYLLSEVMGAIFTFTPAFSAWAAGAVFAAQVWVHGFTWLAVFAPIVASLGLFVHQFIFFLLLPRLKPGRYRVGPNAMVLSWLAQLSLARALHVSGLRSLVFSSGFFRFLYFRSMGARLSYRTSLSLNVYPVDYALITIGPGVLIGDRTEISCHSMTDSFLILDEVVIERGAFVSAHCAIGPGTRLKAGAHVGYGNNIAFFTLEEGCKLKNFEFQSGPPPP